MGGSWTRAFVVGGSEGIVTTSSMAGVTGVFGYAGYSASKFAVVGFSEALRCASLSR